MLSVFVSTWNSLVDRLTAGLDRLLYFLVKTPLDRKHIFCLNLPGQPSFKFFNRLVALPVNLILPVKYLAGFDNFLCQHLQVMVHLNQGEHAVMRSSIRRIKRYKFNSYTTIFH